MAFQSGHGATLAFGTTTTFSPGYTSHSGFEGTRESLDTSVLATTGARTMIGGDLFAVGPQTHTYLFDPTLVDTGEAGSVDDLLFDSGSAAAAETITLTLGGAPSMAGSGHITGFALEEVTTDQLLVASITSQWEDWPTIAGS